MAATNASGGSHKTASRLEAIMGHWGLSSTAQILPDEIAPQERDGSLRDPYLWPARLAEELQALSGRSVTRQAVAIEYLHAAVQARQSECGGSWEVTGADVRAAVRNMVQGTASQALEQAETTLFAGGLEEALEEAGGDRQGGQEGQEGQLGMSRVGRSTSGCVKSGFV
ncbi:hypothetical protein N0V83_005603 [Neocucurbitaria cava]|uniref:Uncharacterized protein n=1 Tax=Neocucurbitaria cava TaxID=798079 RepID=A0A9W8Y8A4_9PLEO|nr:hypothetical protein N0V83_005603 [Neocucurbitaria cava]